MDNESDTQCIAKVRNVLRNILGLDQNFVVDRSHHLDGVYKPSKTRCILCAFNWYVDIQFILCHRKHLPWGIYVNEDLPEEWLDRRKVLKPLFNAAKRKDELKHKTHLSKDKLIIDGHTFSAGPDYNIQDANALLDITSSCECVDADKILFLGSLSPLSNLIKLTFRSITSTIIVLSSSFKVKRPHFSMMIFHMRKS